MAAFASVGPLEATLGPIRSSAAAGAAAPAGRWDPGLRKCCQIRKGRNCVHGRLGAYAGVEQRDEREVAVDRDHVAALCRVAACLQRVVSELLAAARQEGLHLAADGRVCGREPAQCATTRPARRSRSGRGAVGQQVRGVNSGVWLSSQNRPGNWTRHL